MELDCWCTCGKQIYDPKALYCSKECANADNVQNLSTKAVPQTPPVNLHFSITITPIKYQIFNGNKYCTLLSCLDESEISSLIPFRLNFNNQTPLFE